MKIERTNIINDVVSKYGADKYLEIGVRDSRLNFDKINVGEKDDVDPDPITPCKYKMTSDEFFNNHAKNKIYDIIFVDGLHTYEQAYIDVINGLKHLKEDGFIFMHDCNPPSEFHIRTYEEYLKKRGEWNGDVFRAFIRLKNELKDYNCFVVDEDHGCGVITKRQLNLKFKPLDLDIEDYKKISYSDLDENRKSFLDLMRYEEYLKLF